jgi:hypothetical protein
MPKEHSYRLVMLTFECLQQMAADVAVVRSIRRRDLPLCLARPQPYYLPSTMDTSSFLRNVA